MTLNKRLKKALKRASIHYIVLLVCGWALFSKYPGIVEYFPVGTTERLFDAGGALAMESTLHAGRLQDESTAAHALFFVICFLSSILLAIPVSATYLGTSTKTKPSASLSKALIVLPIAVTGLVLVVQNSLALAFSLAGIVAGSGIRFRSNMKEITDTFFFMTSIGIGLAAGVGSLGIALLMSFIFCYTMIFLSAINYGEEKFDRSQIDALETTGADE